MKKILLSIVYFLVCICFMQAQVLYSVTSSGGKDNLGTINKFLPATNSLTIVKSFENLGVQPQGTLTQASNGKLYGMSGGGSGNGIIFSFDPTSSTYTKLKDFDHSDGASPLGKLFQAKDGKLYGITSEGGIHNNGVIFSFDPFSTNFAKLKDFDLADGAPVGSLIQASDGKLYGMTGNGGNGGFGVIFSFDPVSSSYIKLMEFDNINGAGPHGSLVQASDGKFYGMTSHGGSKNVGVIFSFDLSSFTYKKLKDFDNINGADPQGGLIQGTDGKLYGITAKKSDRNGVNSSGAVIFSLDPSSSIYTIEKAFNAGFGIKLNGNLTQAGNGKLYGMTSVGGSDDVGFIFSLDPLSSTFRNLKDFDFANGGEGFPRGGLIQATDGKLYGTTGNGGRSDAGVIFSYDVSSSRYTKLREFEDIINGASPNGSLLQARDGKLYGTTSAYSQGNYGVIFSFDPKSYTYTKLKDFDNYDDGAYPNGSLLQANDGKLYGMTYTSFFSFDLSTLTYKKLSGQGGYGSLIQANDGKIYGMTSSGGNNNENGVIFSFDPDSSIYTKLKNFEYVNKINGFDPLGSLVQATDGKLYGMTRSGGSNGYGVIFSFDPVSSTYTKLMDFHGTSGRSPYGSLIQASDGKLYGMTSSGGNTSGNGVIFSFDPSTSAFKKLINFDGINGMSPTGNLMQASDGKLYGMTNGGGSSNLGVIFSFDPSSGTYTKLKDYDGVNGASPGKGSAFIEVRDSILNTPPAVHLTSPIPNATYISGATIALNATASDSNGIISKVDFFYDTTLLFTATDTPYTYLWKNVPAGNYALIAKATDNSRLVTTSDTIHISVEPNKPPTVSITNPANGETFLAGATIHLKAGAEDTDGTVTKIEFYNGTTLLTTEYQAPYIFDWRIGKTGNYTITARATDNLGAVTISAPINVSVVPNQPPTVSVTTPSNGQIFTVPVTGATINLEALARDPDGRIVQVSFYNDSTLLTNSEHKIPYTYQWQNVPEGTYTITAVAKDNWSAETTSAPIIVTVTSLPPEPLVNSKSSYAGIKTDINQALSMKLLPNPARNILNIYATGLLKNKPSTITLISTSGVLIETKQLNNITSTMQVNISSLASGMYIIKIVSGDKVIYGQFVKI